MNKMLDKTENKILKLKKKGFSDVAISKQLEVPQPFVYATCKKYLKETKKNKNLHSLARPAIVRPTIITLFLFILSISIVSAALNVQLSDQGTGVQYSNGTVLSSGDLTVTIYDASSGGNLIYNETFTNNITSGSWNVMLGSGSVNLPLEFGRIYYKDYLIAGEDASFDGQDRQAFYSPLGDINGTDLAGDFYINTIGNINTTGNITVGDTILFNNVNRTLSANQTSIYYFNGTDFIDLTQGGGGGNATNYWSRNSTSNITSLANTQDNVELANNLTVTGYGFFGWLGSLVNRITTLFAQDIDFNGTITGKGLNASNDSVTTITIDPSSGNITLTGSFVGDGSGLTNLPAGTLGTTINTTEIEDGTITADDIGANAINTSHILDGNITDVKISGMNWTKLNSVPIGFADNIDNNTLYFAGGIYIFNNGSDFFILNETKLNLTIDNKISNAGINASFNQTLTDDLYLENGTNIELGINNLTTTGTGFFGFLGSLTSRITGLFVQDIDFNGTITGKGLNASNDSVTTITIDPSSGNINFTGVIYGNASQLTDVPEGVLGTSINTTEIEDGHVRTADIADGNVTAAKIAADSINGTELADTLNLDAAMNFVGNDFSVNTSDLFVDVSTGRVGIGTASPSLDLHIDAGSEGGIIISDSADGSEERLRLFETGGASAGIRYGQASGNLQIQNSSGAIHILFDHDTGNVGIGTSSPSSKLDVVGNFEVDGSDFFVNSTSGNVGIGTSSPLTKLFVSNGILGIQNGTQSYGAFRFNDGTSKLQFSHDNGTTFSDVGSGSSSNNSSSGGAFYGSLTWDGDLTDCQWDRTDATLGFFTADTDCDDSVRVAKGLTTSNTAIGNADGQLPKIKFDSLPAGYYKIETKAWTHASVGGECSFFYSVNNGAYNSTSAGVLFAPATFDGSMPIIGEVFIPNDLGTAEIEIMTATAGTCSIALNDAVTFHRPMTISVYYFPSFGTAKNDTVFSDLDGDTRINVDGNGGDSDNITFFTAGTQRIVIDNSGNVGIGTTSPDSLLDINVNGATKEGLDITNENLTVAQLQHIGSPGDAEGGLRLYNDGIERIRFRAGSGENFIDVNGSAKEGLDIQSNSVIVAQLEQIGNVGDTEGGLRLYDNGTETVRLRASSTLSFINTGGNLGIGTSSPSLDLHIDAGSEGGIIISNSAEGSEERLRLFQTGGASAGIRYGQASGNLQIQNSSGAIHILFDHDTGNVGIGTTSPSGQLSLGSGSEQGCFRYNTATSSLEISHQCNNNFSIISDAGFYGSLQWDATTNCGWTTVSENFSNLAADVDCDDNARTARGLTTSITTAANAEGQIPQIKFSSLPAGYYFVRATGFYNTNNAESCYWRFTNGNQNTTTNTIGGGVQFAAGGTVEGEFFFASDQGATTITLQAARQSSNTCELSVAAGTGDREFEMAVYYFPQYNSTTGASDYAEWFEKENEMVIAGDLIGLNPDNGKARVWRTGDSVLGIASNKPKITGNEKGSIEEMAKEYALVGLVGQLELNDPRVIDRNGRVYTPAGQFIGNRLADGRVFINGNGDVSSAELEARLLALEERLGEQEKEVSGLKNIVNVVKGLFGKGGSEQMKQEQQSQIEELKSENDMLKEELCLRDPTYSWC